MPPAISTPLTDLLDINIPVIQTAMGWVATAELTAATCNAGAIGFFASASLVASEVAGELARIRELTDRPFGVNVLMDAPGAGSTAARPSSAASTTAWVTTSTSRPSATPPPAAPTPTPTTST